MYVQLSPHFLLVFLTITSKVSCQKASLVFVIDDTRSMGDDIAQVRNEVDAIMDIVLEEKSSQISNIVLVSFNDPGVKLGTVTNNRTELKMALSKVKPHNYYNYDCPEMSLTGVKLALEKSLPSSYVYVFTDASAKDYRMSSEIQQLCQKKQSQIVFVLTGDCHRPYSKNFKVYYDIAVASSGMAFRINKREVGAVLNTIKETIKGNKTMLTTRVTPPGVYTDLPFLIDDQTEYVVVSASGSDVSLAIRPSTETKKIMWTRNGKVVKLINPNPGKYVATVKGTSATSITIIGRSDFFFSHGFSELESKSFDDTTPQPFSNTLTHLSIMVTDLKMSVRIQSAQILDMKENVIAELPFNELLPNFYTTKPFVAPSSMFKVAIIGESIQTGKSVRRIAKIPVTPQVPPNDKPLATVPVVEIKEGSSIGVVAGSAVTLTCKVKAYPSPEITWRNDKGNTVPSQNSILQIPYDYISYLKIPDASDEAKYYCYATNLLGRQFKTIDVLIKDPFIIKNVPEGTAKIKYGSDLTLNCDIKSIKPFIIRWYHVNNLTGVTEQIMSSKDYSISLDGTQLKIPTIHVNLAGKYTCKANLIADPNERREFSTNVEIYGLVPPKIYDKTELLDVEEHMPAVIKCKVLESVPEPVISWQFKTSEPASRGYQPIAGSGAELHISRAELHDSGFYKCVVDNSIGRDEQIVAELIVLKAPAVTINEGENVTVQYGNHVNLTCKVTANPAPTVTWTDDKGNVLPISVSVSKKELAYTYTAINVKQSGNYECRAENKRGRKIQRVQVIVPSPFDVLSHPTNNITAPYGSSVTLRCDIKSHLPIKINWYFASEQASEKKKLSSSDEYWISPDGTALKIKSMNMDSTGAYTCKAFLIDDPDVTKPFTAYIDIGGLVPPEIDPIPANIEIKENTTTIILCNILNGVPKPKLYWMMRSAGSENYQSILGSGPELRIEQAALTDAGQYKCVAENTAGRREQVVAELAVLKAPAVSIAEGASVSVVYGGGLTLTCIVKASPEPAVTWKDNAGNIIPAANSTVNGEFEQAHVITTSNLRTSGTYYCTADNSQGTATEAVHISVSSPFMVYSHPPDVMSVNYGSAVDLICNITSVLPMQIHWYYINDSTGVKKQIQTSEQYSILSSGTELKINSMAIDLDGKYICNATLLKDDEYVAFASIVEVNGLEAPRVTGDGNKNVKVDTPVSINCNVVKGVPKPKISWQFMPISGNQFEDINNTGNVLLIPKVHGINSGYYKCTAKNTRGTDEHIVVLKVEEPARIVSKSFTVYEGIVGDIAMRIPCETVGYPKPTIEWKVEGTFITQGTKYSIDKGALIIKNLTQTDGNLYTCKATNNAGSEAKTFKAIVEDTLTNYGPIHHIYVLKGQAKELKCNLPHSSASSVKWFIEGQDIGMNKPYLILENAQVSNDGNYTCHVSGTHGSATETYEVDVGYPPSFKFAQDDTLVDWNGDPEDVLDCNIEAKPQAHIEWTFNGKLLIGANSPELYITKQGHYQCNASNVHGTMQRNFDVKPSVCLISRNSKEVTFMPLMLTEELTWPEFIISGEYYTMKPGDKLILSCHNHELSSNAFQKFPARSELEVFCDSGDTFVVNDRPYKLSDLQCNKEIYPTVVKTNTKCLSDTSELMRVGYNLKEFVEAYEVCFDHAKNLPLYAQVFMTRSYDIFLIPHKWHEYPGIGNGNAEPYTCENALSSCCYAKSQLISARDFNYEPTQNSTLIYPLNAIPHWRPCDSDRLTWEDLGNKVRSHLNFNPHFVVWSGVHTLQEKNNTIIPRYLWKVIRESEETSVAVVYVNDAAPTSADIKCRNICGEVWWLETSDPYTYCCTMEDFLQAFELPGSAVGESFESSIAQVNTY